MSDFDLRRISPYDREQIDAVAHLLQREGLKLDHHLDDIYGIYDESQALIATGAIYHNTLRCIAIDAANQGLGLMNTLISHLMRVLHDRGYYHLFVYTKVTTAKFFEDVGFYPIARVDDRLVFLENRRDGFATYLQGLQKESFLKTGKVAAIVMNANPFTLGHRHLIETACQSCDWVHLFMVSEDQSVIPFEVRKALILAGTQDLTNLSYHETGPYLISSATFPAYFLKDEEAVIRTQADLDMMLFMQIAKALHITDRFVGEEPTSQVTHIYNETMASRLIPVGIALHILPRKTLHDRPISASQVRLAIKEHRIQDIQAMVPPTTYAYLTSPRGQAVVQAIQAANQVIHY